jgi:DNA-binding MarR family transcriptional regulator
MLERVDSGLTLPQYRLLTLLDAGDERSTALAHQLAVSKPAISTAVDALVVRGHVIRRADDGDRRASWLTITDHGRDALHRADEAYATRLRDVAGRMDDPRQFLDGIAGFAVALEEDLSAA